MKDGEGKEERGWIAIFLFYITVKYYFFACKRECICKENVDCVIGIYIEKISRMKAENKRKKNHNGGKMRQKCGKNC